MIPKSRLDALTDGVFAVAMTLLVIDLRLPEDFRPSDNADLLQHLAGLGHQVLVYVVSFYVLALCWLGLVRTARGEEVGQKHAVLALTYLLLITFLPFATMVVGRNPGFPAAVWLYAANMTCLAGVALRMAMLAEAGPETARKSRTGLYTLIAASAVTVVLSFIAPRWAMSGYLLNLLDGPLQAFLRRCKLV